MDKYAGRALDCRMPLDERRAVPQVPNPTMIQRSFWCKGFLTNRGCPSVPVTVRNGIGATAPGGHEDRAGGGDGSRAARKQPDVGAGGAASLDEDEGAAPAQPGAWAGIGGECPRPHHTPVQPPRSRFHHGGTFAARPFLRDMRELDGQDVAIVGAPFDGGTTYRPGARFGRGPCAHDRARQRLQLGDGRRCLGITRHGRRRGRLGHPGQYRKDLRSDRQGGRLHPRAGRFPRRSRRRPLHRLRYPRHRLRFDGNVGIIHFDRHFDLSEYNYDERMHGTPFFTPRTSRTPRPPTWCRSASAAGTAIAPERPWPASGTPPSSP